MTEVINDTIALVRGVPKDLFVSDTPEIPGIIGGHIDANALPNADDIVDVQLQVKYTSGGAFTNAGLISFTQSDEVCWFTPLEASFGYKLIATLRIGSPSANASLAYIIQVTVVP